MLVNIILLVVIAFVIYAAITQYKNTDPTTSPPQRIIAALGLAVSAVAAVVLVWFHNVSP